MAESSSSSMQSDDEREEMLDRMLTRLAFADDSKLESLLSKLLPYCISSLSSQSAAVRKKVMEILTHVNKRVKNQPEIGLPFSELWKIYREADAAPMVKNFSIVYIEMAFERLCVEDKANIAPDLIGNVSKFPPQHQDIILRIVAKVIGECHANGIDDQVAAKYRLMNNSQDGQLFLEFCLQTILFQPPPQGTGSPAGLSIAQSDRITGKQQLRGETLLMRKLGILNVIQAMELAPEVVYPLYVVACSDSQEAIVKRGEELVRKKASGANLDDPELISRLFLLFNGTIGVENIAPDSRVNPANSALRTRLMSIFCRSIKAANSFPSTLQCIFGCIYGIGTTSRLKQLGMEFTVWVFKHAVLDQLKVMGPVILSGILRSLDSSSAESDATSRDIKTFAFQAIGLLAQRIPQLFRDKIDMAVRLFDSLRVEDQLLRLTIQEATTSLAIAYKGAPSNVLEDLESLLLKNSQVEQSEVRFCAVRWATSLFELQHCPSRYICMLRAADSKLDIREMALEGLFPMKDQHENISKNSDLKYPKLKDMLAYICKQKPELLQSSEMREEKLLFPSKMYVSMIKFLLMCFEASLEQDNSTSATSEWQFSVELLCSVLEHAMAYEGSAELHATASKGLIDIGSYVPKVMASRYAVKIFWLKQLLSHLDSDTRESAARLLGIACSALSTSAASDIISELLSSIGGNKLRFESYHGALCAVGYVTAECMSRTPSISEALLQCTIKCLVDVVNSETATLASIAMQALGHIGLCCPLPPLVLDSGAAGVLTVLHDKLAKLLSGDDIKVIQKIVLSLGHICVKETSISLINIALDLIFSLCRSKVEDVLFAAGEALSFMWGGVSVTSDVILKSNYSSLSLTSNFLKGDVSFPMSRHLPTEGSEANEDSHVMARDVITRKLFDVLLYSNRKEERRAGTVWLLSLTMYCGHHPKIQQLLPEIQEAFSHLLGEQDNLTQELASQGMSIVYELGDASMKKDLVNALVGTLTGSGKRKRVVKLMEDSEVFQEGSIGESPSGGKLSTYKELCNLANEMGQPDLIYKFMNLANYQASINSKRGAAFGFSKIAKQAGDALQPHLRLLIPRLVRYQYDPDKNVQDAMSHIWKSLVADSKKTIDEHLDLIIDDLLTQCGSRLWRSREASCLALADIIQGRKFEQVSKHLKRIWTVAFRAMDDIKETVRVSGDSLCRAMSSLTIRLCDVSLTAVSDAKQTMDIVLPILLTEGIMSKVSNIQRASVGMVMKLSKGAGIAIRPHLPDLVCCMLESLSSLEDQKLNYVEMHAASVGIQTEKLENLRISVAKGSPMWETLDMCLKVVDVPSLDLLVPRLAQLVRSGVGLNTRVGVASFINLLVEKVGADIKPFTNMLLKLLFPAVKDEKSGAAKRAFASACGITLKYSTPSQAQKLIEETAELHRGDRSLQISCAVLLKNYLHLAADVVAGYHATVFPVIFVARFEDDKDVSGLFEELWEENTSSERVTLQYYMDEIISLLSEGIMSSSWANKKRSAKAIRKLSEVLGESLSSHHHVLLKSLMKELPGRLWEGKDTILYAIAAVCLSCHSAISVEDPEAPSSILNVIASVCTKKDRAYCEAAFFCLEQVINAFSKPEFFNMAFPLLFEFCKQTNVTKPGQSPLANDAIKSEEDNAYVSAPHDKVLDCITSCISVARLSDLLEQGNNLMNVFLFALSPGLPWTVKMATFSSMKELFSKLQSIVNSLDARLYANATSLIHEMFCFVPLKLTECMKTVKIAQVHISASDCLLEITQLYKATAPVQWKDNGLKNDLVSLYEIERSEQAKSSLRKCINIIEDLELKNASTSEIAH
ncbi:PREDICTED: proteasome-associated protein ECM29 homolog isoform X2 [Nelumbo nucifera]|uniref:Proteasome-associated protein ECM29 homolog isoform X2 n=1 Tax=Nelumbo nucifera TaxID=4432 RepID=A0A1U8B6N1_NELNU|nr:PREDICTED: proteasome-associated protein ECM29 homolog isoform X2 [Nelumbo nucifera]